MNSNEFLILAENNEPYNYESLLKDLKILTKYYNSTSQFNYESLPKDSIILQKCSDEIDEKEFQFITSSL